MRRILELNVLLTCLNALVLQVVNVASVSDCVWLRASGFPGESASEGDSVVLCAATSEGVLPQTQLLAVSSTWNVIVFLLVVALTRIRALRCIRLQI